MATMCTTIKLLLSTHRNFYQNLSTLISFQRNKHGSTIIISNIVPINSWSISTSVHFLYFFKLNFSMNLNDNPHNFSLACKTRGQCHGCFEWNSKLQIKGPTTASLIFVSSEMGWSMSDSMDLSLLTDLEIRALSKEVITAIPPERFTALTIPQLHSLTYKQLMWLTSEQWAAMLPTQKLMLFTRFSIKPIDAMKPQVEATKPAVSSIASRFMNPNLLTAPAPKAGMSPKRTTEKKESPTNLLFLAHLAVYVAVITLPTSGDFLTTTYSQQAKALSAIWSPKTSEVVLSPVQTVAAQIAPQSS